MPSEVREVRVDGVTFSVGVRDGSVDGQFWDAFADANFEPATLEVLRRELGPGRALLDVGAWIGPFTLYAAALGVRVVAVEADPVAVDALHANLALNSRLADRVEVIAAAVAHRGGPVALSGEGHALGQGRTRVGVTGDVTVDAIDVAALDARADLASFDVVKIDIEGGEFAVVPELARHLQPGRTTLLLSLHGPDPTGRSRLACVALRLRHAPTRARLLWSLRRFRTVRQIGNHRDATTTLLRRRDLALLALRLGETELILR